MEFVLPGSDRICIATTKDISAFGVQFNTTEKLEQNSNLDCTLKLPNSQNPVHVTGRIAWLNKLTLEDSSPYDVGIEFVTIEEDNKNTFLKYLCDLIYG